jgi:hypothetical protein
MSKVAIILFSMVFLHLVSCTKSDEKNKIVFTGKVIDQITKQPVPDADVYYSFMPFCDYFEYLHNLAQVKSGNDGAYSGIYIPDERYALLTPCNTQYNYAKKEGYAGSSIVPATGGVIEMYHFSELELHVINDPLDNRHDLLKIWIIGNQDFYKYPGFREKVIPMSGPYYTFRCEGQSLDTLFVLKLWGNLEYLIGGGVNYMDPPWAFSYNLHLVPDVVEHLDITF